MRYSEGLSIAAATPSHAMPELVVDSLTKEFPTRGAPLVVLRGCSLTLSAGENLAILGPSGSGKSTLLQIIGGLDRPTSGSVRLRGQDPFALDESRLADFRNMSLGFVFQDHCLLPQCSALENVLLPALAAGDVTSEQAARGSQLRGRFCCGRRSFSPTSRRATSTVRRRAP
jgi:lipoprotein-releasing system ATP-binding protein